MIPLGWVDSGLRSGAENLAIDRHWLQQCVRHALPGLLRFYRSAPCASLGRDQAIDRELRTDYCRRKQIPMLRRITGGGALYLNAEQYAFSLILPYAKQSLLSLQTLLQQGCAAIAAALLRFGIPARHKFPNDLEVNGRKIASLFAAKVEHVIYLHGSVLLDVDLQTMLEALRTPTEKLSPDGLAAARDRFVGLRELYPLPPAAELMREAIAATLADVFGLSLAPAGGDRTGLDFVARLVSTDDLSWETQHAWEIDWHAPAGGHLEALWQTPGGLLRVRAALNRPRMQTGQIEFAASTQAWPADLFQRLAGVLQGVPMDRLEAVADRWLRDVPLDTPGLTHADILHLIGVLADKHASLQALDLSPEEANAIMPFSLRRQPAQAILKSSTVMLVPYCAKPAWCQLRHADDCSECGLCEVGEAYRLGRERGMRVTTVTRYEHLVETLTAMKSAGVSAYVGMCCSHFFIKRQRAFREAGIPGVLMDIGGANCYELRQEDQAYAGTFSAQARIDETLLNKVMQQVPHI